MTPKELAENVKRLRELDAKRAAGNWYAHYDNQRLNACVIDDSKEGWDRVESDYTLIDADESPNLEPDDIAFIACAPQMMETINALVALVGEMRQPIKYGAEYKFGDGDITRMFEQALAKAAPIAELAKGE